MDAREINKAMAAHGVWKVRLREAIESGHSEYQPQTVARDRECEFGKWLHSIPVTERPAEFWDRIRELHTIFHQEAGKILALALDGEQEEALTLVGDLRGRFVTTSIELTNALQAWKQVSH
ncbi:hypothetical protein GMLC_31490 [Geomonas limicola]|uniref:Chemoreceptor zinc-binding domain-containing protein n=1 Tax=Geomonas limicola TaxID=2740186 RepID=A0A6V8NAU6_9BACT|nr:CZB domain-containing protein [Geomonas limicola]GFO69570.1 hypothetical protein GMLC_31490 [Geomonas limicola]